MEKPATSAADLTGDAADIWAVQLDLYQGFLTGDRARTDSHIHPDGTMWDSEYEPLIRGLDGLQVVRDLRPTGPDAVKVADLDAHDPVITVWGDTAVSRHLLTVLFEGGVQAPERIRNTGVWRRIDGAWLNVHNHEDVLPG